MYSFDSVYSSDPQCPIILFQMARKRSAANETTFVNSDGNSTGSGSSDSLAIAKLIRLAECLFGLTQLARLQKANPSQTSPQKQPTEFPQTPFSITMRIWLLLI